MAEKKKELPKVFVKRISPKDGKERAQIQCGNTLTTYALSDFTNEDVRRRLESEPIDRLIPCESVANPVPGTIKLAPPIDSPGQHEPREHRDASPAATPGPISRPPGDGRSTPTLRRETPMGNRITGFHNRSVTYQPSGGGPSRTIPMTKLGVSDQVLGMRRDAELSQDGKQLARYALDVQHGLGDRPDVDCNPYNFAEWDGCEPRAADEPLIGTHERERATRRSGVIDVTFTARTPVFVPVGTMETEEEKKSRRDGGPAYEFFHCWNGTEERYAIPGSSMKGAVRALFEALTNSRCGVTDRVALGDENGRRRPPLYRRRSGKGYIIRSMPTPARDGEVEEVIVGFFDANGNQVLRRGRSPQEDERPLPIPRSTLAPWRANLFWVPDDLYAHGGGKTQVAYHQTGRNLRFPYAVYARWKSLEKHPHLIDHKRNVDANEALSRYKNPNANGPDEDKLAPPYDQCEHDLFTLGNGDLLFGIEENKNGVLACFGKNVNFLWPAEVAPIDLVGPFAARAENAPVNLADADTAEATFGFVAPHRNGGHPFRGRVRFTTFWAGRAYDPTDLPPEVELMPLTSPSGTKAKARPLYLQPGVGGLANDYVRGAKLRGRKFYWHQSQGSEHEPIAIQHDADRLVRGSGAQVPQGQRMPRIRPLPATSTFTGQVHFSNLTDAELGALVASIHPGLAFGSAEHAADRFGIKIGKGKPRGLGSLACTKITVQMLASPSARYASLELESPVLNPASDPNFCITQYKQWITNQTASNEAEALWRALPFVRDLGRLLRLPPVASVRVYPPNFSMYGWSPEFGLVDGDPKGGRTKRPKAMNLARVIEP